MSAPGRALRVGPETHRLEFFGDDCPTCRAYLREIEAGKCFRVELSVHRGAASARMRSRYGVRVAPTVIVDGQVKLEGWPSPDFAAEYGQAGDCRAALALLLQRAPPMPGALRVGEAHALP